MAGFRRAAQRLLHRRGSGHPIADNVTIWLYERGWHGIAVEPQADLAALYAGCARATRWSTAPSGAQAGEIEFHVVDRLHGFSTTVERMRRRQKLGMRSTVR